MPDHEILRPLAEHEAAHAVVAGELGCVVTVLELDSAAGEGRTHYRRRPGPAVPAATIAGEVWQLEFGTPPRTARGCRTDRARFALETTSASAAAARAQARTILAARRREVLDLAERLLAAGRLDLLEDARRVADDVERIAAELLLEQPALTGLEAC